MRPTSRRYLFAGILVAVTAGAAFGPNVRLARELAAARADGLWTTADDVRRAVGPVSDRENAGPEIQRLAKDEGYSAQRAARFLRLVSVATRTNDPMRQAAREEIDGPKGILTKWRAVSARPRLDYRRPYEEGYRVLFPELVYFRTAVNRFLTASSAGLAPRENLLVAARLTALMRSEPGVVTGLVAARLERRVLDQSVRLGCGREVAEALGPAADVRRILGPELSAFLDTADSKHYEEGLRDLGVKNELPLGERILHYGPFVRNTKAVGTARWRQLWSRLPRDGSDLAAAATVVDEELPKIDALMPSYAEVMTKLAGGGRRGDFLREIGKIEDDRRRIQASR